MSRLEKAGLVSLLVGIMLVNAAEPYLLVGCGWVVVGALAFLFGGREAEAYDDGAKCVYGKCGQPHDPKLVYGGEGKANG